MVGQGVLLECLDHPEVEKVLSVGRTPLEIQHPKLDELIVKDFMDYSSQEDQLTGFDSLYLCMGVSASGMSEEKYSKLTYDYTLALAKVVVKLNRNVTCTYVSGDGTDTTEKGRIMWARVKGRTENALLALDFKDAYMFRPGIIIPLKGIKSKTKLYQFMYDYFMWAVRIIKKINPKSVVNTTQMGLGMIHASLLGFKKSILHPADIIELAKS